MKKIPTLESIKLKCGEIDDVIIKEHLEKMSGDYFAYFSMDEVYEHLSAITGLSEGRPVEVICREIDGKDISCTLIAYDYPAVLSLITGVLASMGFRINSGRIFTYKKNVPVSVNSASRKFAKKRRNIKKLIKKRIIIDNFIGTVSDSLFSSVWVGELEKNLSNIFILLGEGDGNSVNLAKEKVNELVSRKLSDFTDSGSVFYPVKIEINNKNESYTEMRVSAVDTPFFLYALTTSLSLQNIQIEHVHIKTVHNQVVDEFCIVDSKGKRIEDHDVIDRIKFSVLLTKQFTYFLGTAPDPYAALSRFEYLTEELISYPERRNWFEMLSNPHLLKDLAKLLGTSDFIWEDFIRLQYETIIPMLKKDQREKYISGDDEDLAERIVKVLEEAETREDKIKALNEFKDREIFLIDLDHILNPDMDFRKLSERLTGLANRIIRAVAEISYEYLAGIYGVPRTVAGIETKYSILGLGKFGGSALGYASDIELLVVYRDNGRTEGERSINNSEFFELFVKEIISFIKAKKEGIFHLDLRLRPYGNDGPLACSLDTFCSYYGRGGDAHSYEKLALVRMRPVAGDKEFGLQLKRLRNEYVYTAKSIDLSELHELRKKQFQQYSGKGRINAKFSPGALVDLEYAVQILQVIHGKEHPELRTSRIHSALTDLAKLGILEQYEKVRLIEAYDFLRKLINGLRMLRGSAKDLYMPEVDSVEYGHLARRMGYTKKGDLSAAKQLHIEFDTRTAMIRTFIEKHFGRDKLPGDKIGNVADIILSKDIPGETSYKILSEYGFRNPERALTNLRKLAGQGERLQLFARLAILATDILLRKSDPDMALNNWERFIAVLDDPHEHFKTMLSQPMELDILLNIFSASHFLSHILIKNPDFLDWVISPENLHKSLNRHKIEDELRSQFAQRGDHEAWLNSLRRIKKREILRIGTRDICLGMPLDEIVKDLSILAEASLQVATEINLKILKEEQPSIKIEDVMENFCIMAFGKLGGNELNYSSDIDLMMVIDKRNGSEGKDGDELYYRIIEMVSSDLSKHTVDGYAYRVDLRLRPYGTSGALAYTVDNLMDYYKEKASLWEIQALLKIRPIAGNRHVGYRFIDGLTEIIKGSSDPDKVINSIEKLRAAAVKEKSKSILSGIDIKNGIGGIRDIEFLVQGLQLINLPLSRELFQGNTLVALKMLKELGVIDKEAQEQLTEDYIFVRKVEHYLQLYEDRQVHSLPKDPVHLEALAKLMLGIDASAHVFMEKVENYRKRIREAYNRYLIGCKSG